MRFTYYSIVDNVCNINDLEARFNGFERFFWFTLNGRYNIYENIKTAKVLPKLFQPNNNIIFIYNFKCIVQINLGKQKRRNIIAILLCI